MRRLIARFGVRVLDALGITVDDIAVVPVSPDVSVWVEGPTMNKLAEADEVHVNVQWVRRVFTQSNPGGVQ